MTDRCKHATRIYPSDGINDCQHCVLDAVEARDCIYVMLEVPIPHHQNA
jgi:hypothetical protein